jgi:rfaE bifunctional protein kinase chain/domain
MTTAEILTAIPRLAALVVGDICLDRWCTYDPSASDPSRETGIPRLGVVSTEVSPGGGGNVATNLAALRPGRVGVLGVCGDDGFGFELARALARRGINPELMVKISDWHTFTYTKVINSNTGIEDKPRLDFISTKPLPAAAERQVLHNLQAAIVDYDAILVADQAETNAGGVVTPAVRGLIIELAARHPEKVFLVDSRLRADLFRKVALKPNEQEAEAACRKLFGIVDYQRLRRHVEADVIMVTHGQKGVLVVEEGGETWSNPRPIEHPVDTCGAGDSFMAGAALALAATHSPLAAAHFGNLVASLTIMKKGTGTASPEEVLAASEERLAP